jgi:LysM repeat protein
METVTYTVKPGDSLSKIAVKYGRPAGDWKKIYSVNPGIKNPNLIYPGQQIKLPVDWTSEVTEETTIKQAGSGNLIIWAAIGGMGYWLAKKRGWL